MSEINIKALGQQGIASKQNTNAPENKVTTAKGSASNAASQTDSISLTHTGEQIQALQQIIAETPELDQSRVERIKAAIDDGSYVVDSTKLAQNLLKFEGLVN